MLTCFWVYAKGALQQMVHTFADIYIKPWVTILEHNFFLKVLALLGSALEEDSCIMVDANICSYPFSLGVKYSSCRANRITNLFPKGLVLD